MPVLDAAAIINAHFAEGTTVPEVIGELKDFESRELANAKVSEGRLVVRSPSKESVEEARKAASPKLSATDLQVLALGLELKEEIVTDDYALQASAKRLGIRFRPVIFTGINP